MPTSAQEKTRLELLVSALADWVHLGEIHHQVEQDNPGFAVDQVRLETLNTIRSLVLDGLFEVGDLSGPNGEFVAWRTPLEESIERIAAAYIEEYANETAWLWVFWLQLTGKGRRVAEESQQQ